MDFSHPYQAYAEGNVFSCNPLDLVIALYEGTIDAVRQAKACLENRDIPGRSKAINKAMKLLTELLVSLDHREGGEISANLKRLYSYLQCRILEAHSQQVSAPLSEAEALLTNMLEGWRGAAKKFAAESAEMAQAFGSPAASMTEESWGYGFVPEAGAAGSLSVTF